MSSISGNDAYNARIRAQIREYQEIEASRNSPVMIMDSPTRRGHITPGTNAYSAGPIEGGRRKGLAKTLHTIGKFVRPVAQPILQAATARAVHAINTGGRSHAVKKKGFAKFMRNVGEFVRPVAQPLLQAATRRGVHEIETYGAGKREDWLDEVRAYSRAHDVSWGDAMIAASAERHRQNGTAPKIKKVKTDEEKQLAKAKRAAKKAAKIIEAAEYMSPEESSMVPFGSGRRRY